MGALAAAITVTSRYIACLRRPPSARHPEPTHAEVHSNAPSRERAHRVSGQDAADEAVDTEDPEFIAILTAWENVASAEEAGAACRETGEPARYDDEKEQEKEEEDSASQAARSTPNREGSACCAKDTVAHGEDISAGSVIAHGAVCASEDARRGHAWRSDTAGGSTGCDCSPLCLANRAREILRELDAADPQGDLLGPANAWVVKPAGLSCGRGVAAVSSLRGVLSACDRLQWKAVAQKYVERPLLVQVSAP